MVESRIDEDACIIPCARLDANRLVNKSVLREVFVGNGDGCKGYRQGYLNQQMWFLLTVLAQQRDQRPICAPDNVFDRGSTNLCNRLPLLNVIENNSCRRTENEAGGASIEDLVRDHRRFDALHDGV